MNAAAVAFDVETSRTPVLAIPRELCALFEESAKIKASFWRLEDRDRRGFLRYIDEATTPSTRDRRAAIVGMSLIGLARDIRDEHAQV
jgi:uncharacterized protein YdeI (YjbR/CyaY-like superfamily)